MGSSGGGASLTHSVDSSIWIWKKTIALKFLLWKLRPLEILRTLDSSEFFFVSALNWYRWRNPRKTKTRSQNWHARGCACSSPCAQGLRMAPLRTGKHGGLCGAPLPEGGRAWTPLACRGELPQPSLCAGNIFFFFSFSPAHRGNLRAGHLRTATPPPLLGLQIRVNPRRLRS